MCGRYSLYNPLDAIAAELMVDLPDFDFYAIYNAAPTQLLPVVTNEAPDKLQLFRWGLIPFWAKDPSIGNKMINARAETLTEKPAFRQALKKRRCLIPVNGFFEWKAEGKRKVPYHITLTSGKLMTFAGLWETWKDAEGKVIHSFTIITTQPNKFMEDIHNRMPVIIPPEKRKDWLDTSATEQKVLSLLVAYPDGQLTAHAVSTLVNSPVNNVPEVIEPAGE